MSDDSSQFEFTLDDLFQHVMRVGLDVHPPIDVRTETGKINRLFEEFRVQSSQLYQELRHNPHSGECLINSTFEEGGQKATIQSLVFGPRGPVFRYPVKLPDPFTHLSYEGDDRIHDLFLDSIGIIKDAYPALNILRVGWVQEVIIGTGERDTGPFVTSRYGGMPGANPKRGEALVVFQDAKCNIRIAMKTMQIERTSRLVLTQQVADSHIEHGLAVEFDVNNIQLTPQSDGQIQMTLERAKSLWPDGLLDFLNWRGDRS